MCQQGWVCFSSSILSGGKKTCCFSTLLAFCFQMLSRNSILLSWFIIRVACEHSIWTHLLEFKKVKTFTSVGMLYTASFYASHSAHFWSDLSNLLRAVWEAYGDWSNGTLPGKPPSDGQGVLYVWSVCCRLRWILPLINTGGVTLILCLASLKTWVLF